MNSNISTFVDFEDKIDSSLKETNVQSASRVKEESTSSNEAQFELPDSNGEFEKSPDETLSQNQDITDDEEEQLNLEDVKRFAYDQYGQIMKEPLQYELPLVSSYTISKIKNDQIYDVKRIIFENGKYSVLR